MLLIKVGKDWIMGKGGGGGEELSRVDIVEFLTACFSNGECTVYI